MDTITKKIRNIWSGMVQRCHNPNTRGYKWYGAKGITVCDEWRHFRTFKAWALSEGFEPGLSIERIDNSKGYCPENCKWIPLSEQGKNKTDNHYITFNGETKTITDWGKHLNVDKSALSHRLRRGWNEHDALAGIRQVNKKAKYPELDKLIYSKFKTRKQMAEKIGMDYGLLSRILTGFHCPTVDEAYCLSKAIEVPLMRVVNILLQGEKKHGETED